MFFKYKILCRKEMCFLIRRASQNDICIIEDILYDSVVWMKKEGISNLWTYENTRWSMLEKSYHIGDFYLYDINNNAVACMALTRRDDDYWFDDSIGSSLYLHKLAVKRSASGMNISKILIDYVKYIQNDKQYTLALYSCDRI